MIKPTKMERINNQKFDNERAFYGVDGIALVGCSFDGPADGESALKEAKNVEVIGCYCNLRYPFWHDENLLIKDSEMTDLCRAALWYSQDVVIADSKLHGIKAVRECRNINLERCSVISTEFGWFNEGIKIKDTTAQGEYFLMRSKNLLVDGLTLKGKYSFQYVEDAVIENCVLDTKDAFWHAKNVVVRNCVVKGEYLAWYADGLTFENCKISGTQPLCYCKNLKLINCEMNGTDLSFEKSDVDANVTTHIDSVKNPLSGRIMAPSIGEIILDEEWAQGEVIVQNAR